jgi:hypothetical protein
LAGGGQNVSLDTETHLRLRDFHERRREGRFRELFNVTHDEYLDTPRSDVTWLLLIANAVEEGEIERAKRERQT